MAYTGGDLEEITFTGSLGTFRFRPKSSEGSTFDIGGIKSETTGMAGGTRIRKMNAKHAMFKSKIGWDMNDAQDLESVQAMANDPGGYTMTVQHINGIIYTMLGASPEGDITGDGNEATVEVTICGDSMSAI